MSRLPLHTIDIPPRDPFYVQLAAGQIVFDAFVRCGISPHKAAFNPACIALAKGWAQGEIDDASFERCCRNLLILNPKLAE